jgi:UDP-glucose 4-epimerase
MRVLVTGAFGNIGTSVVTALLERNHAVTCFDLENKTNKKALKELKGRVEVVWGDLRRYEDVSRAVEGQNVVVHLAFVIPKLSATGVGTEDRPEWARSINVGGTQNLISAMRALPQPPALVFASSMHVYGDTQHQPPPRTISDPVCGDDHYTRHKIECERMVKLSGLRWTILRFAAALPIALRLDPGMFDVPFNNRMEFVHTRDVGVAVANAITSDEVWGRIWHIGGAGRLLDALGIGMLPKEAFASKPFATDWLDTADSQRVLHYQQRTLDDYTQQMVKALGYRRYLVRVFRPAVRLWLLSKSPYYRAWYRGRRPDFAHMAEALRALFIPMKVETSRASGTLRRNR